MAPGFFVLKVTPSNFASRFTKVRNSYNSKSREAIDSIAEYAKLTWQLAVPVKTGKLRNSIQVKSKKTTLGVTDLRSEIIIASSVPYFDYIDRGTKESPGRYVPVLGKRLTNFPDSADFGFHPGIVARNITDGVQRKIEKETGIRLNKMLRSWASVWGAEFSGA